MYIPPILFLCYARTPTTSKQCKAPRHLTDSALPTSSWIPRTLHALRIASRPMPDYAACPFDGHQKTLYQSRPWTSGHLRMYHTLFPSLSFFLYTYIYLFASPRLSQSWFFLPGLLSFARESSFFLFLFLFSPYSSLPPTAHFFLPEPVRAWCSATGFFDNIRYLDKM